MISLANNHILDFGENAVLETMRYATNQNIKVVGAGENRIAADKVVYLNCKGYKIGFIGISPFV